jgi:hypothetical protein
LQQGHFVTILLLLSRQEAHQKHELHKRNLMANIFSDKDDCGLSGFLMALLLYVSGEKEEDNEAA